MTPYGEVGLGIDSVVVLDGFLGYINKSGQADTNLGIGRVIFWDRLPISEGSLGIGFEFAPRKWFATNPHHSTRIRHRPLPAASLRPPQFLYRRKSIATPRPII